MPSDQMCKKERDGICGAQVTAVPAAEEGEGASFAEDAGMSARPPHPT